MNLGFSNIKPLTLAEEVLDSPSMFSVSKPPVLFIVGFSEICQVNIIILKSKFKNMSSESPLLVL